MPKSDVTSLDRELRGGRAYPAYAVIGEDSYLSDTAIRLLKSHTLGDAESEFGVKAFNASDAKSGDVIDSLKNISLLAGKMLVVIREADKLDKGLSDELTDYVLAPAASSTLVLEAKKMDGRLKLVQAIAKVGMIVECKPLYDDKVPSWINIEVKRQGKQISHEAAQFMADLIGNDTGQLSQAIEKTILYVGDKRLVDLSDVEGAVAETHQRTIFELTDAIGQRKLLRAVSLLHNILENGGTPVMTLGMMARHFRILSKAKEIAGRLPSSADAARYLGVHPFYLDNYLDQSRNFSAQELRSAFRVLHECDRGLKNSRVPKDRVLERALFQIIGVK